MPETRDIAEILSDVKTVEGVLRKGVHDALVRHKQAGKPVVEWRDGQIVWVAAEDLDKVIAECSEADGNGEADSASEGRQGQG